MLDSSSHTDINPFLKDDPLDAIAVGSNQEAGKYYLLDPQNKVSVYLGTVEEEMKFIFSDLKVKGSLQLYNYIERALPENQDWINLKVSYVMKRTGMSRSTILAAITDLKNLDVIRPKAQSVYWVNPRRLFRGNRVKYFRGIDKNLVIINKKI